MSRLGCIGFNFSPTQPHRRTPLGLIWNTNLLTHFAVTFEEFKILISLVCYWYVFFSIQLYNFLSWSAHRTYTHTFLSVFWINLISFAPSVSPIEWTPLLNRQKEEGRRVVEATTASSSRRPLARPLSCCVAECPTVSLRPTALRRRRCTSGGGDSGTCFLSKVCTHTRCHPGASAARSLALTE